MLKFKKGTKLYLLLMISLVAFSGVRDGDISESSGKTPKQETRDVLVATA